MEKHCQRLYPASKRPVIENMATKKAPIVHFLRLAMSSGRTFYWLCLFFLLLLKNYADTEKERVFTSPARSGH
jgi:hypothetical protein